MYYPRINALSSLFHYPAYLAPSWLWLLSLHVILTLASKVTSILRTIEHQKTLKLLKLWIEDNEDSYEPTPSQNGDWRNVFCIHSNLIPTLFTFIAIPHHRSEYYRNLVGWGVISPMEKVRLNIYPYASLILPCTQLHSGFLHKRTLSLASKNKTCMETTTTIRPQAIYSILLKVQGKLYFFIILHWQPHPPTVTLPRSNHPDYLTFLLQTSKKWGESSGREWVGWMGEWNKWIARAQCKLSLGWRRKKVMSLT